MTNRELTKSEKEAAKRLKAIWDKQKKPLNLTQEKVAKLCEWQAQSSFSSYLIGRTPLNPEAIYRLAKVFHVHPFDIMPELAEMFPPRAGTSDGVQLRDEENQFLMLFRRLSSKQKTNLNHSLKEMTLENEQIFKEYIERGLGNTRV